MNDREKRTTITTKERKDDEWLKWSRSLRGTGAYLKHQLAEIAQDLGDTAHQNRIDAMLGGPSEEVVFTDQQL